MKAIVSRSLRNNGSAARAAMLHGGSDDHHSRYRVLRAWWSRLFCRRQVNSLPLEVNHV